MLYEGTDIEIKVNDKVTWYFDDSSEGVLVGIEKNKFKVKWDDMSEIVEYSMESIAGLRLA